MTNLRSDVYTSAHDMAETCLLQAYLFAKARSKDPNTKVGACVYDPASGGLFLGYNSFPKGFPDLKPLYDCRDKAGQNFVVGSKAEYAVDCDDGHNARRNAVYGSAHVRVNKYMLMNHAEENAIRKASAAHVNMSEATLYVTHFPCHGCMTKFIIPFGIKRVMYADPYPEDDLSRWVAGVAGIWLMQHPTLKTVAALAAAVQKLTTE